MESSNPVTNIKFCPNEVTLYISVPIIKYIYKDINTVNSFELGSSLFFLSKLSFSVVTRNHEIDFKMTS